MNISLFFDSFETILLSGFYSIAAYWLYLLWIKKSESAFFWLMMGIGIVPLIELITSRIWNIFITSSQQTLSMNIIHLQFLFIAGDCFTLMCLGIGLWRLGKMRTFTNNSRYIKRS